MGEAVIPGARGRRVGTSSGASVAGGIPVRFAFGGVAFLVGGRADPPEPLPPIRGRPRLIDGDSPLVPRAVSACPAGFPLLARADREVSAPLRSWARAARRLLDAHLEDAGAVLLRDLPLPDPQAFSVFVRGLGHEMMRYESSLASREEVAPCVTTANRAAPEKAIPMHNEMSFARPSPRFVFLYCDRPPEPGQGGETPILRNVDWERALGSDFIDRLERRGLLRSIRYPDRSETKKPSRSWQLHFRSHDRAEVERRCRERGLEPEWGADGSLTARSVQQVTIDLDGRRRWFCAPQASRPMTAVDLTYADGTPLEPAMMERLRALQWQLAVAFAWRRGDVLCVDNLRCQHGRLPFAPEADRRVYVAIAGPWGGPARAGS